MATKSTPLKRKLESNSDTPSKKQNWLSLGDKLDIIKRYENGSSKVKIADEKGMKWYNIMTKFQNFQCDICTYSFWHKFFNAVFVHIDLDQNFSM